MKTESKKYLYLVLWIVFLILIGSLIGRFSQNDVATWYQTLNRSPLTPPDYVFGIAWTLLYAMIGASGWLIWEQKEFSALPVIKRLYVLQLIINWSWMPLFFGHHLLGISLLWILGLILIVGLLIVKTYNHIKAVAVLLIPYFGWLIFASYLNFYIWQWN